MKKAVIDRIVDNEHVALLVDPGEQELIVPIDKVPSDAKEGDWLMITNAGEILIDASHTLDSKNSIKSKMEQLRNRKNKSLFKRE